MLRILLVSPLDPEKPGNLKFLAGGENTYTRTLLTNNPRDVRYVHFEDALKQGVIEYSPVNKFLWLLAKFRILPISSGSRCLKLNSRFDLIHCHSFSIRIDPFDVPIVLSDSSSNYLFLRDYINWSERRIRLGYFLRRKLFELFRVVDADTNPEGAKKIIVFSKFALSLHKKLGVSYTDMDVIQPGLPKRKILSKRKDESVNVLFVGIWFERKGGLLLIKAFERLSMKYKNIKLTIIGEVPKRYKLSYSSSEGEKATESRSEIESSRLRSNNIEQLNFVPREKLMTEFFPNADIFVLVPPKVEGFGFAVLEAMSFGIPVIVSRVCALPELVEDNKTGFVIKPNSLTDLTFNLERLIKDKVLREKMGKAARKRFEERFTVEVSNEKLLKVYRQALL